VEAAQRRLIPPVAVEAGQDRSPSVPKENPMRPSSILCRAQEARQYALAAGSTLPNVRSVANLAAAAWAKEAVLAEGHEQRTLRRQAMDALAMPHVEQLREEDHFHSENPDRGFADRHLIRV
jgi:hypothetical protein